MALTPTTALPTLADPRDRIVHCLVLAGLTQLDEMQMPAHAVVSATVDAARALGHEARAGMIDDPAPPWVASPCRSATMSRS